MTSARRFAGKVTRSPTIKSRPTAATRVVQTGAKPRIYDREDWLNAFLPKDESPMPGDVKFLHETESSRVTWKLERDDLRLAPASPMATDGPDLSRIPQAPPMGDF